MPVLVDAHLSKLLTRQGVDPRFVVLKQDYASRKLGKEHSPYARFWEDTVSHKRVMEVGILPRVTNAGFFVVPKWQQEGNKYKSEENCFEAEVEEGTVQVTCVNDQPNGRKKFDQAIWHPQVYLDGVEQHCGNPIWLETDHMNPNYHFNVLEYDYGFCKRRIRIIEGRIRDRITLASNPDAELRVANNTTGNMRLRFGSRDSCSMPIGIVQGDVEIISKEELAKASYPITIGASPETFYPAAGAASPVDGRCYHLSPDTAWATIQGGAGTGADDAGATDIWAGFKSDAVDWAAIYRAIILFNTAGLPDDCYIIGAVLSVFGEAKVDDNSCSPAINVYSSAPADPDALVGGDYNSLGTEALATEIAYAAWSVVAYNDFTLIDVNTDGFATNADGTYIDKEGITELGLREATYDVTGDEPAGGGTDVYSYMRGYAADQGDTANDPKLVVTYVIRYYQAVGSGAVGIAGSLNRKTSKVVGAGSIAIAGTLIRLPKIGVGGGAVGMAGTLGWKFVQAVGQGAVAIAGALSWKFVQAVGGGAVAIAGGVRYAHKSYRLFKGFIGRELKEPTVRDQKPFTGRDLSDGTGRDLQDFEGRDLK